MLTSFPLIVTFPESADSGKVTINGKDVSNLSSKQRDALRLNQIGFVLQAYNLVPYLTVKEQFSFVNKIKKNNNLSDVELEKLLKTLGIYELKNKYPDQLSGGQKQRVAIARALYANPEIILADEPTAALDSEKVKEVGSLLSDLAHKQDKAIIVVTHDIRLENYADKVYHLDDGILKESK